MPPQTLISIANLYKGGGFAFWFYVCSLGGRVLGYVTEKLGWYRGHRVAKVE